MSSNRKKTEEYIIKYITKISPKGTTPGIYQKLFKKMSDNDFDSFMKDLETEDKHLSIIDPNFSNNDITIENNLKIGEEIDCKFFEKIWVDSNDGKYQYLSLKKHLILDMPVKRASQVIIKKIRTQQNTNVLDSLTGQPSRSSKGASISYVELQLCAAMGLDETMIELMKFRGGDIGGNNAYNNMLFKLGVVNLASLKNKATGVESTKTVKIFLTGAMLKNNL